MPSLRRTLSSPSVRSSPYSYPSSANTNGHATRAGGYQPRRSSGSDTNSRRVLADLDWWLVQDGQYEVAGPSGEQDADGQVAAENEQVRAPGATVVAEDIVAAPPTAVATADTAVSAAGVYESDVILSSPLWDVSTDSSFGLGSPEVC